MIFDVEFRTDVKGVKVGARTSKAYSYQARAHVEVPERPASDVPVAVSLTLPKSYRCPLFDPADNVYERDGARNRETLTFRRTPEGAFLVPVKPAAEAAAEMSAPNHRNTNGVQRVLGAKVPSLMQFVGDEPQRPQMRRVDHDHEASDAALLAHIASNAAIIDGHLWRRIDEPTLNVSLGTNGVPVSISLMGEFGGYAANPFPLDRFEEALEFAERHGAHPEGLALARRSFSFDTLVPGIFTPRPVCLSLKWATLHVITELRTKLHGLTTPQLTSWGTLRDAYPGVTDRYDHDDAAFAKAAIGPLEDFVDGTLFTGRGRPLLRAKLAEAKAVYLGIAPDDAAALGDLDGDLDAEPAAFAP